MDNTRKYIAILAAVLLAGVLSSCSIKTRIKRADKKFEIGEYYDAGEIYKQVYGRLSPKKDKPLKAYVAFRQGECNRILNNTRAESMYKNAVRYKYAAQDSIVYLRLAQVQAYQGKYRDAEKNYQIYLDGHPDNYLAQAGLYACRQMTEWKNNPSRYRVSLAKEFNAKRTSNFAPAFIGSDADALMFTSNRQEKQKGKKTLKRPSPVTGQTTFNLYSTRKNQNGEWEEIQLPEGLYSEPEEAESENDSTSGGKAAIAEMGACCFTGDGKTMYFTYSKPINGQDMGSKIFLSIRTGGEWSEPKEVKLFLDSTISVGHPSVNPTGDTLYFASDAPGGFGGKDIWMAEREEDSWINVQNLGPQINTAGDELFPSMRADGVFFYSTNGHPGYGGLDIYKAVPLGYDTAGLMTWDLYNLGLPINSQGDDFGITFEGTSDNGYFSSNRGQKKGIDFIYRFVLPEMVFAVEGMIQDNNGEAIANATLRLVGDDGTNQKVQARRDGTYRLNLKRNARYVMLATARGYLNQKQELTTRDLRDSKTFTQDFQLMMISKPVTMDNIFYEFGKWDLTPESETGMQALVKLLNDNPNITIELSAHTDMKGDSVFNKRLSEKRAESCVRYLIEHGIDRERLTPVGYGKDKPVVADKALNKRYRFIPEGQTLTPEFIMTLTEEQQEICNQINRRTEFKVLRTTYKLY